jgi:hypothetical protein
MYITTGGPEAIYDLREAQGEFGPYVVERLLDFGEACWVHEVATPAGWRACPIPAWTAARILARLWTPR